MLKHIFRLKSFLILSASLGFPNLYCTDSESPPLQTEEIPPSSVSSLMYYRAKSPPLQTNETPLETKETPSPCLATVTARHIESGGVGYRHGYSTVEGLIFPAIDSTYIWPFIDIRAHRFDNTEYAANGGLGFRYYASEIEMIFGFNTYFDYRTNHFHKFHFSQVGAGFEFLHPYVDVRLNGYLPLKRWERVRKCTFRNSSGQFFISRKKVKAALDGVDLEIGSSLFHRDYIDLYGAVGTYFYERRCKGTWGGMYRLRLNLYTYFFIEGLISHDPIYRVKGQGQIGVNVPLGCRAKNSWMQKRLTQPIQRHEIIVLDKYCRWRTNL